ncbi:MAG: gamma-glutamyltransferase, partial [Flavobacteriales bacterium]|nr:gamma-glutamyltransferase [Flavobacteriales bacterium]
MHKYILFFSCLFSSLFFAQSKVDSLDYYRDKNELIKALNYAKTKSESHLKNKKFKEYCEICIRKAQIFGTLNDHGPGLITPEDMAAYRVKERPPVCGAYRAYKICSMGEPSSGGLTLLSALG